MHSPGPTIARLVLDLTIDVNLIAGPSELSAEDNIDAGGEFQSLMVSGKKVYL